MVKIGFAIITHNEPEQLLRLVNTLTAMFDGPRIACHHSFDQCPLSEARFPSNVRFVRPPVATRWGSITIVNAALKSFALLREHDRPDWFVLLSGSDYPVKSAGEIIADLSATDYDAFLDHRELLYNALPPGQNAPNGFGRPDWVSLAYDRYCTCRLWPPPLPGLSRLASVHSKFMLFRNPFMSRWLQFNRPPRIYGGAFWLQANRKAMDRLLDHPSAPGMIRYFTPRWIPEESFFHSMLCNAPDLRISTDNKRYEDWTNGGHHPKWLEVSDVPSIVASGAHFARKFRPDGVVQGFISETVLGIPIQALKNFAQPA